MEVRESFSGLSNTLDLYHLLPLDHIDQGKCNEKYYHILSVHVSFLFTIYRVLSTSHSKPMPIAFLLVL